MSLLTDFYNKAKKKLYDVIDPIEERVSSGLGRTAQGARSWLSDAGQKASGAMERIGDYVSDPGNTPDWMKSADSGLRNFSESAAKVPEFDFAEKVKNPIGRMAAEIPQGILNIPSRTARAAFRDYGKIDANPSYLSKRGAEAAGIGVDIGSLLAGGPEAKSLAKNGLESIGKSSIGTAIRKGAIKGMKEGTAYGATQGALGGFQEGDSIKDQGMNALKGGIEGAAMGAVGGGILGGAFSGAGHEFGSVKRDIGKIANPYSKRVVTKADYEAVPGVFSEGKQALREVPGSARKVVETVKNPFVPESVTGKILTARPGLSIEDVNSKKPRAVSSKIVPKMTEDDYLNANGAVADWGDPALHHNRNGRDAAWRRAIDRQLKSSDDLVKRREGLRAEYRDKTSRGEIEIPTRIEQLVRKAYGHEDNESVKAARRLLEKKGIDWRNEVPYDSLPKPASSESAIARKRAKARELVGRQIENQRAGSDRAEPGFVAPKDVKSPSSGLPASAGDRIFDLSRSEFSPYEKKSVAIGNPAPRVARAIEAKTGVDVSGFNHEVDNYALRHALQEHSGDPLPISEEDFRNIPEIVSNPDSIAFSGRTKQGLSAFRYKKNLDGTVYYVEEVRTGKNTLSMKTMYKEKTPGGANYARKGLNSVRPASGRPTTPQGVLHPDNSTKSAGNQAVPPIEEFVDGKSKASGKGTAFDVPEGGYNEYQKRAFDEKSDRIRKMDTLLNYPTYLRRIGYTKKETDRIGIGEAERILKLSNLGYPKKQIENIVKNFEQTDRIIKKNVTWSELKDYYDRKKALDTHYLDDVDPVSLSDISPLMAGGRDVYRNFESAFGKNYPKIKEALLDPFDAAKGSMVDEENALLKELDDQVVGKLGIRKGSKLDHAVVDFGEGKITLDELREKFPKDWQKAVAADQWFRNKYPELLHGLNVVREENFPTHPLYPESTKIIPQRKDYYRHGKDLEGFSGLRNMFETSAAIDPELAATSDVTNPKTKWLSFAQRRKGDKNDLGAVEGYLDYVKNYAYAKHIDPFIQRFKGVDDEAAKAVPHENPRIGLTEELSRKTDPIQQIADSPDPEKIKGILKDRGLSDAQSDWMSKELAKIGDYDKARKFLRDKLSKNKTATFGNFETLSSKGEKSDNKMNNFLVFMKNFSRDLAGKTNPVDRPLQENVFGRKALNVVNWANSRFKANAVLGNLSSSVAQFFNIPQGVASAGARNTAKGLGRSLAGIFKENGPIKDSSFIKERFFDGYGKFDDGILASAKKFAVWVTGIGDEIGTKLIWNSHYAKAVKDGISDPVKYADDWTRKMVAGRGIGEVPIVQKSRIMQLMAPFQLEVANQWYALRDIAKGSPSKMAVAKKLLEFSVASFLMNSVAERIRGSRVSFDPFNAMADAYGEFRDSDSKLKGIVKAAGRVAGEAVSNVPFGQTLASAYPEYGFGISEESFPRLSKALNNPRKDFFGEGDPTRFGTGGLPMFSAIRNPLTGLITPYGGKQLERSYGGIKTLAKGYAENGSGKVMTPVDRSVPNLIRGPIFGKGSLGEVRDYYENGLSPLSDSQTEKFKLLGNSRDYFGKVSAERASAKEKEALRGGKAGSATDGDLPEGMDRLSNGNVYVRSLDREFPTADKASLEMAKDDFSRSGDSMAEYGDKVFRKSSDGTVSVMSKDDYRSKLYEAQMSRMKRDDDIAGWTDAAGKRLEILRRQMEDPGIDDLEKESISNSIGSLESQLDRYRGYGGFAKPKKEKKLEEKWRYPLIDPDFIAIDSILSGGRARKIRNSKSILPLTRRAIPKVRRSRKR